MIYYTLVQTAEVNGVSPYWYLLYLMTKLPPLCADGRTPDDKTLEAMMPWSKEYKQFEYESKQEQISRHLEPDDERPVAPKKKRAFSATCA